MAFVGLMGFTWLTGFMGFVGFMGFIGIIGFIGCLLIVGVPREPTPKALRTMDPSGCCNRQATDADASIALASDLDTRFS